MVVAVVQLVYGVTRGYKERLDIHFYSKAAKGTIHFLAWVGYCYGGIIIGITGIFFSKPRLPAKRNLSLIRTRHLNLSATRSDMSFFIVLAPGRICYGIFMIVQGSGQRLIESLIASKKNRPKQLHLPGAGLRTASVMPTSNLLE